MSPHPTQGSGWDTNCSDLADSGYYLPGLDPGHGGHRGSVLPQNFFVVFQFEAEFVFGLFLRQSEEHRLEIGVIGG